MLRSINPYTGQEFHRVEELSEKEIDIALEKATSAFRNWRKTGFAERAELMRKAAAVIRERKQEYGETMTKEMGKPISQSLAELEKCAWVCEYYAENAEQQLAPEEVPTDADNSYISYEPLGPVLAVMPWNYPFWQVFRFAAPALMAGNVGLLKHASNVMLTGQNIEKVFEAAGFPEGCFKNLTIGSKAVDDIIRDKRIKAVTLTGSTSAGSAVASTAGEMIKKSVLELGGSNALVIFRDADLEAAAKVCVQARYQNTGQSCIAGKRLLVQEEVYEEFLKIFREQVEALKSGDPMDADTFIGVQAREDLAKDLEDQVNRSVEMGARIVSGGKRKDAYYEPTILTDVSRNMPVFTEETFGPAIGITVFREEDEAVELINASKFGLGVSIFTQDRERAKRLIPQIEDGAVFVNELVKSDPRLPFGGTKESGFGRELSFHGIREFVNVKTVYFKNL